MKSLQSEIVTSMVPVTVTLPFPAADLNPNRSKGRHWASTADLRKKARTLARVLTLVELDPSIVFIGDVPLSITFVSPDRRHRDRDNLLAASKPMLDGVADALGIDDRRFEPITISRVFGEKPGAVLITIGRAA